MWYEGQVCCIKRWDTDFWALTGSFCYVLLFLLVSILEGVIMMTATCYVVRCSLFRLYPSSRIVFDIWAWGNLILSIPILALLWSVMPGTCVIESHLPWIFKFNLPLNPNHFSQWNLCSLMKSFLQLIWKYLIGVWNDDSPSLFEPVIISFKIAPLSIYNPQNTILLP